MKTLNVANIPYSVSHIYLLRIIEFLVTNPREIKLLLIILFVTPCISN